MQLNAHKFDPRSVFTHSIVLLLQPPVAPIDEYGALIYAGRWGIHGATLPGRATFAPGNVGFATFGASRPMDVCACLIIFAVCLKKFLKDAK